MALWVGFTVLVLILLAVDLLVINRRAHRISIKEASIWSGTIALIAFGFFVVVHATLGPEAGLEFLTGYLIEEALSVDNVFVFVLIFSYFKVPPELQHRVLFWGVLGAMIGRGVMIGAGTILIHRFEWIIFVFGAFLVLTGIRMGMSSEHSIEPRKNPVLRLVRRFVRVTPDYHGQHFFVRERGPGGAMRTLATPLFVVLVMVETTDLIFAVDSIPAIFAVTRDPFIVYSSNVLAVLGLRALYFVLADVIHRFHYLKVGLAVVLTFVGAKMLLSHTFPIPTAASLGVVVLVLGAAVAASLLIPARGGDGGSDGGEGQPKTGPETL